MFRLKLFQYGLDVFTIVCAVVGAQLGDCSTGTPSFLYALILFLAVVAVVSQFHVFGNSTSGVMNKFHFFRTCLLGVGRILHSFTAGQQIATSKMCDYKFHEKFVLGWHKSAMPFMGDLFDRLHIYGVLAVFFVLSVIAQEAMYWFARHSGKMTVDETLCMLLSFTGLTGALSAVGEKAWEGYGQIKQTILVIQVVCQGLIETLPALYFQTTMFTFTFAHNGNQAKAKQIFGLLSVASSLNTMMYRSARVLQHTDQPCSSKIRTFFFGAMGCFCVLAIVLMVECALRVYFSFKCPTHLWNLSSGCVDWS